MPALSLRGRKRGTAYLGGRLDDLCSFFAVQPQTAKAGKRRNGKTAEQRLSGKILQK